MQTDFSTLLSSMRGCRLCTDLPLGPNPIFQLAPEARILIVGQAPGRITHAKGRPFDDPSGDRLRDWLGLGRDAFYSDPRVGIFPMALCFPGSGPGGDKPPPPICAQTWRGVVMQALDKVDLTLVLGAHAIAWHLPQFKRQRVAEVVRSASRGEANVFALPHPSPRNNRWLQQNAWFEAEVVPGIRKRVHHILRHADARSVAATQSVP